MRNELFRIGPIMVYGYGLMIAIGIMLAYLLAELDWMTRRFLV